MAANSTVRVSILGDWSNLKKTFSETETGASKWAGKMESAGKGFSLGLTAPIVAGAALSVKAASEEQVEMEKLAGAIQKNIPGATEAAISANEDWITSMQNVSGVADSDLRNSIQQLVQAGVPLEEAQSQTAAAMDIAAAKGVDLASVTEAMVKANNGNTKALGKLVGQTKDASGEALTMDQILQNAADTMGGTAATAADTAAGRAEIMKLRMGDLSESIGAILLPILDKLTSALSGVMKWFEDLSPAAKKMGVIILGVAAAIGPVLIVGAKLVKAFQAISQAFKALQLVMAANPWLLLIAAVIALVILIIANWDKITAYLRKVWDWITRTSAAVWEGIKKALKAALDFIVNLFLNWTLAGLIVKNWDKIKDGVSNLKDWLIRTWDGIVSWFKGLPGRIGSAVSGMWDGIKTAFRNAINWIIRKWNNLSISIGGGTILGVDIPKITVSTPNIPTFQSGGTFRAPAGSSSGLALLHDRERVLPAGRAAGGVTNLSIPIYAGLGSDPNAIAKAVLEALQRYQRVNGPLPLDVRLN